MHEKTDSDHITPRRCCDEQQLDAHVCTFCACAECNKTDCDCADTGGEE
jgi:hypothetical protein